MKGGQCCKSNGGRTAGGGNGLLTGCYHHCAPYMSEVCPTEGKRREGGGKQ